MAEGTIVSTHGQSHFNPWTKSFQPMDEGTGGADPQLWPLRGPYTTGSGLRLTDRDRIDWGDPGGLHIFIFNVVISLLEPLMSFCSDPNRVVVPSERQIKKMFRHLFYPGVPSSTRKSEIPCAFDLADWSVMATTMTTSARMPFVMKTWGQCYKLATRYFAKDRKFCDFYSKYNRNQKISITFKENWRIF
jgi:hypothetical protein